MKRLVLLVGIIAQFCVVSPVFARPLTTEEKLTDFRGLVAQVKSGYGPLLYKKEKLGIDLDVIAAAYEPRVAATQTNRDFYYTLVKFISEFKDGHFNATVPTDHQKELPLGFDLVEGRVLIDWIDEAQLPKSEFPFERGDELVVFDGLRVSEVVKDLMTYMQGGTEPSIRRKAVWTIALRRGSRVPVPFADEVGETKIVHSRSGRIETVKAGLLKWKASGTPLDEFLPNKERRLGRRAGVPGTNYGMLSVREEYLDLLGGKKRAERSYACNAKTRIHIPEGATMVLNPPDNGPFTAYYHYDERFGGNVGYIRIPDYYPQDAQGESAYEERFAQYEYAVSVMERNTVGLVIDQDHNCGGSVEYLEKMLGLFYTGNYRPQMFELLATKESYLDVKKWVEDYHPFSLDRERLQKVIDLVKSTSAAGTSWLTPQIGLTGRDFYAPNEVHYTKPIVILVDEMAGSGGDAFPSHLGHTRATLVGSNTGGLGGHVVDLVPLYFSRMGGRITKSLFYRADGVPVENNGAAVAPENEYHPTYADFVDGYRDYQAFYLGRLLELVQKSRR